MGIVQLQRNRELVQSLWDEDQWRVKFAANREKEPKRETKDMRYEHDVNANRRYLQPSLHMSCDGGDCFSAPPRPTTVKDW